MKKSLIALAALTAAIAGPVAAQSNVTVYGLVDAGLEHQTGAAAGTLNKLTTGAQTASRIGFKGTEDIGNGVSANFVLENGFDTTTGAALQGGTLFGRQAFVGLKGNFGGLTLGRQYTPIFAVLCGEIDPMGCGLAGNAANLMSQGGIGGAGAVARTNNSIKYVAPVFSNINAEVIYGLGEVPGSASSLRTIGGQLGYTNGPITARLAFNNVNDATGDHKVTLLGAKYNFGVAVANVAYAINKGAVAGINSGYVQADTRDALVGVSVPFGASTVIVSYINKSDKSAAKDDAHQFSLGYTYALSKRTNLYTSVARMNNTVASGTTGFYAVGNSTEAGAGNNQAVNAGVRHSF